MADKQHEAIEKRAIKPVKFTVEITATRMNQNWTLSGLTMKTVNQSLPKENPMSMVVLEHKGGALYAKITNNSGITYLTSEEAAKSGEGKKPKAW